MERESKKKKKNRLQGERGQSFPRASPQADEWKDLFSNFFWVHWPQSSTVYVRNCKRQSPRVDDIYWDCLTISNLKYIKQRAVYSIMMRTLMHKYQIFILRFSIRKKLIGVRFGFSNGSVKENYYWTGAAICSGRFFH